MVTRYSLIVLLVIFLCGCSSASPSPTPAPTSEPTSLPDTPTPAPDYTAQIRNSEYQLGLTDALKVVQLTDGKFEQGDPSGADYVDATMTDYVASGDLNGDGVKEVAALVAENYGGSGVFVFLAVYEGTSGTLNFQTSTLLGDRTQPNKLSIEDGKIFLDATIQATNDPMCCPTLHTTRHYVWNGNNQLDMTDYTTFTSDGKARTITLQSPVDGTSVSSFVQVKGSVDIAPFENNLAYRIYDTVGVELSAGAVSVSATDAGGPGTFEANIPLGNVLSGAAIRLEIQDVNAADGSLLGMDSVELVVK